MPKLLGDKPLTAAERRKRYEEKYGADYIKQKSRERYLRNKERVLERSRQWAKDNPEKVLEKSRKYREQHADRAKAASAKYECKPEAKKRSARYRDSGKAKIYKDTWKSRNKEQVLMQGRLDSSRRRARVKGNGVFTLSPKDRRWLMQQNCVECNAAGSHIDHIIPVSRGGAHSIGNLQILCAPCNLSKHNKTMIEWRAYRQLVGV